VSNEGLGVALPFVKGQCHQYRPPAQPEPAVVGAATVEHHSMLWVVAVVAAAAAALQVKNA